MRGWGGATLRYRSNSALEAVAAAQLRPDVALREVRMEERDEAAVDLGDIREVDRRLLDVRRRLADRRDERRGLASAQPAGEADASVHAVNSPLCRTGLRVHVTMHGPRRTIAAR